MHGDQPDLDDDDGVPRVDYVDRERDGRLARYAAAARRTPGNDRHQTRTHVGYSLSRNVSDLPSTAWEIADSSKLLLPPFGALWPHDEDPIASAHECEVLRDEMPSPSRQPCTAGLGTGVRDKFQSSLWKKIAAKPAETTPFSDTNKTTCSSVKLGTDTATAIISKGSGAAISDALDDKTKSTAEAKPAVRRRGSHAQVAASRRLQAQATPVNVGFTTPAHSCDACVTTQTHLYKAASDDKERDPSEHHGSESIDEILSSGSDSDADNRRGETNGITSLGLMDMRTGGLGLMSAFTRLHALAPPSVHLASMTGMTSAMPEKPNSPQSCKCNRGELDMRLRRVISKAQHSQCVATPAQDPPNLLGLQSTVFDEDNQSDKECVWVSFLEFTLEGEPRVETGLWLWSCTLSRGGELNQDDSHREIYDVRAMTGDQLRCRSTRQHERVGNMLIASTAVAFIAVRAGELNLVSGAQLRVRPPWHEFVVGPTKATGFERRRVFLVTRASVEVVPT
mmetsp:Transcript_2047/g.7738  ORF Transcript_2047/g.7738 Transcript_2047/m.7738 type:complete len:509 (-) Transcript_2047:1688-3214(-)